MKKHELVLGIIIGILISSLIYLFLFKVLPEEQKDDLPNLNESHLKEKLESSYFKKAEIMYELHKINFVIAWTQMELESIKNNMTVQYKKLGDSGIVGRFEYDGSFIDDIEINLINGTG